MIEREPVRIRLTPEQLEYAHEMGLQRQQNAIANRRKQRGGGDGNFGGFRDHREKCCAEYACSIYWKVPWSPTIGQAGGTKNPNGDLCIFLEAGGLWIEIRHSTHDNAGLIYYPRRDKGDRPYVLVTGKEGSYSIHGWLVGWDCLRLGKWQEGRGDQNRWLRVPHRELNSLGLLEDLIEMDKGPVF